MKYHIKNCKVISKGSKYNNKIVDIIIDKGIISEIGKNLSSSKSKVVEFPNLHVSQGWLDIGTQLGEPGHENRETFETLSLAATSGGYTDLACLPNTTPPIETAPQIKNLIQLGKDYGINIHPIGALSHHLKGENIAEFNDMHKAGAVAFSEGLSSIEKGGLLLRALQYARKTNSVVFHHPNDKSLSNGNQIHEGEISITLGLKGSPTISETIILKRDIELLKYSNGVLCCHLLSSQESVKLLKQAKKSNDNIKAGVSYLNLVKTHEDLIDFDSNLKVEPVLRSKTDQKSLRKNIDQFDYIASNHQPIEIEQKNLEFSYAESGVIGLETCFAAINSTLDKDLNLPTLIDKLTNGPASILGLNLPPIETGSTAKLTFFNPKKKWTYSLSEVKSLSKNSPFIDQEFTGKALGTFNNSVLNII